MKQYISPGHPPAEGTPDEAALKLASSRFGPNKVHSVRAFERDRIGVSADMPAIYDIITLMKNGEIQMFEMTERPDGPPIELNVLSENKPRRGPNGERLLPTVIHLTEPQADILTRLAAASGLDVSQMVASLAERENIRRLS